MTNIELETRLKRVEDRVGKAISLILNTPGNVSAKVLLVRVLEVLRDQ